MGFKTKLDFSNNRQVKQFPETFTVLSGGTEFGLPYSALTTGPNLTTTAVTQTFTNLLSTFSGNSATTVYTWYDSNMAIAENTLSAITPSTSAITQNTGVVFTGNTTGITTDGYSYFIDYSGVSFDLVGLAMIDLGGGNYSGSVHTNLLEYYSAATLDYSGRTIWVDVNGITRTEDLIVTNTPILGYVLMCVDNEGKVEFRPVSAATTSDYWISGSSGNFSLKANNPTGLDATGNYALAEGNNTLASGSEGSHAEGYQTTASGSASHSEGDSTIASGTASHSEGTQTTAIGGNSHAGGFSSIASGLTSFVHSTNSTVNGARSAIIGGSGITANLDDVVYVPDLVIDGLVSSGGLGTDANGMIIDLPSDQKYKKNINTLTKSLDKILKLRGVSFEWNELSNIGKGTRYGLIAQEVKEILPDIVRVRPKDNESLTLDYIEIIPLIIEAFKELLSGETTNGNVYLETQSILAEDNNIDLNYGGNKSTALNGGIRVLHGKDLNVSAEFLLNSDGNWFTNNYIIPNNIAIPEYTPSGSTDNSGIVGSITRDENYLYVKTNSGWKRSGLESF